MLRSLWGDGRRLNASPALRRLILHRELAYSLLTYRRRAVSQFEFLLTTPVARQRWQLRSLSALNPAGLWVRLRPCHGCNETSLSATSDCKCHKLRSRIPKASNCEIVL